VTSAASCSSGGYVDFVGESYFQGAGRYRAPTPQLRSIMDGMTRGAVAQASILFRYGQNLTQQQYVKR